MAARFFILLCTDETEKECISRNLFGTKAPDAWLLDALQIGDTGFLFNIDSYALHGVFEAKSQPQPYIEPGAWQGRFPIQVRVAPRGKIERLSGGFEILTSLGIISPGKKAPSFPIHDGLTTLHNLLAHFHQTAAPLQAAETTTVAQRPEPAASTWKLPFANVAGLDHVKSFIRQVAAPLQAAETTREAQPPSQAVEATREAQPPSQAVETTRVAQRPEPAVHTLKLSFNDVAGLDHVKSFIRERMIDPVLDTDLARKYRLRLGGGVLLYGPPGNGKTLIAKATAGELEARFEEVSPSVIRGYPGNPDQRLENLFRDLRSSARAVLFLDEAEALLARREDQKSSVMERITPVLLTQFDGIFHDRRRPFLVIAATNAPWKIDEAFLRTGLFDKCLYVAPPDESAILVLLSIYLHDRPVAADLRNKSTLKRLASLLSGYSGADIEQIVDSAALEAYRRARVSRIEELLSFDLIAQVVTGWPKSIDDEVLQRYRGWVRRSDSH
ncbi:MAG: AAA family ATPase [Candidatus Binatia bacterium]